MKKPIRKKPDKFPFTFEQVGDMVERLEMEVIKLREIQKYGLAKTIREKRAMHRTIESIWKSMKNPAE